MLFLYPTFDVFSSFLTSNQIETHIKIFEETKKLIFNFKF